MWELFWSSLSGTQHLEHLGHLGHLEDNIRLKRRP